MYPILILLFGLSLLGSAATLLNTNGEQLPDHEGTPQILADNFFVYAGSVASFVGGQVSPYTAPGAGNHVPDAALTFPSWYVRNPRWQNKVVNGMVTVYATSPFARVDLSRELAIRTSGSWSAGITAPDGQIISLAHGATGNYATAGTPVGVPVFQFNAR